MSLSAMKYALQALENPWGTGAEGVANAIIFLRQAIAEAEKQPVHASDISQECVDETAKCKHDLWIAAACLKSTVESAIKAGDWKVDGACDPTRDLAYLADCLANPKREWVGQPDLARVGEVGVWGDKREWVGLTDEEIEDIYAQENHADVVLLTQAKLKEKNT